MLLHTHQVVAVKEGCASPGCLTSSAMSEKACLFGPSVCGPRTDTTHLDQKSALRHTRDEVDPLARGRQRRVYMHERGKAPDSR
jgi:hypothetical protein